jgi:TolB protein
VRRSVGFLLIPGTALPLAVRMALGASGPAQEPPPTPIPTLVFDTNRTQHLALPECIPRRGDEASREGCRTVRDVLKNDLQFENLFRFVSDNMIGAIPPQNPDAPNFADWQGIGASLLVTTRGEVTGGDLAIEAKVYFIDSKQTLLAKRYAGRSDNPRIIAHQLSDDILALAQYRGVARTRIAFTSDRDSPPGKRVSKELYIMDYDGYNARRVTVNNSLNILPNWRPDGRALAYVSYRQGVPDIFLASIFEGKSANLTNGKGQSFAPVFSPDGKRIAYFSNRSGNNEIWIADADGSNARQITSSRSSEASPCWSPTGQEIAFTSDRLGIGAPQIYVMDTEGLNVRRVTTVGNYNDAPAWNPSKQFSEIAYTARLESGKFDVAVIDLVSRQVRQITQGRGSCEYPSWAPSGRHLVFSCSRPGGKAQITVADRLGQSMQTLPAGPGNNVHPDWGP